MPDQRDIPFQTVFRVPRRLPEKIDLRRACSAVEDQGDLGSCTAQALVGALEFLELNAVKIQNRQLKIANSFTDLSRLFVYYLERDYENTVDYDSGAYIRDGIKMLKKFGACRESLWPYDISKFACQPSKNCYTEAEKHQITSYQRLSTLAEMKSCLAMGLPFVGGFTCYESLMSDDVARTGDIPLPKDNESVVGGHAILFVGYDDKTGRAIIRNSWGESWGQKGYGALPYEYLKSRDLSDDFWCIQTTESNVYAGWLQPGVKTDFQIV